jgi:hypothetical protein
MITLTREQMHALWLLMEDAITTVESGDYGYGGEWFPHTEVDTESIPKALNAVIAFLNEPVIKDESDWPRLRERVDAAIDTEDWMIQTYPPDGVYP